MRISSHVLAVVSLALVASLGTGCAANAEPEESAPAAVDVEPAANEADSKAPPAVSSSVSPQGKREVCRWMTCIENGERFRCWVCY